MLVLPEIPAFDEDAAGRVRRHQLTLTKPPGSLGRLEDLAAFYAGVRGQFPAPVPARAELFVFAADHGVATEGVSAYPAEVTAAMVGNFRRGGAAVNVLARQAGVEVTVVDVGVKGALAAAPPDDVSPGVRGPAFVDARVAPGTRNLRREPAMSPAEVDAAVEVGLAMAAAGAARGADLLVGGDMGIANTTAATALLCALGGEDPANVVGRGAGVDDEGLMRKIQVIRDALVLHGDAYFALEADAATSAYGALRTLGGLEIAALVGLMLGGAARRVPVIVDGFIAGAAALVACRLRPGVRAHLLLSHLSAERGARRLAALVGGPVPLLDLGMRLGEGTGATLAVPLVRAAVALQNQMATFAGAGVFDRA